MSLTSNIADFRKSGVGIVPRKSVLAEKAVHALLRRIKRGTLTLHDGDQVQVFGANPIQHSAAPENSGLVDGSCDLHATIVVESPEAYQRVLHHGITGAGEAYIAGLWTSPDILQVIRIFSANMQVMAQVNQKKSWLSAASSVIRNVAHRNTRLGSKRNIVAHYDLSNEFFETFLDQEMMYSSAIFPSHDSSLEVAARYKLRHICETLQLSSSDHVLEIGCGWGGFAMFAAREYGCKVTAVTISDAQYERVVSRIAELKLDKQVTVQLRDYRDIDGTYDKLVSIEMIEAVGHQYFDSYFEKCSELLKPHGSMLIQAITIADQRYEQARNSIDYIKRYIFPGGCLPSAAVITQSMMKNTDLQMVRLEDITDHYARTLAEWRSRFYQARDQIEQLGFDNNFIRMWDYYLAYCEGGFRERIISTVQFVAAKPLCKALPQVAAVPVAKG